MRRMLTLFIFFCCSVMAKPELDKDGWLPFVLKSGAVYIEVEVAGESVLALVDSGAEFNGINKAYVQQHKDNLHYGSRIIVQGVVGEEEVSTVTGLATKLMGFDIKLVDLVPIQMAESVLLLGHPFLSNFIVQFDYPRQKLRLLPHSAVDMKKVANVELKKSRGRNLPVIKVDIAKDQGIWLTLDTGNTGGLVVSRQLAEQQNWLQQLPKEQHSVSGVTGAAEVESFQIPYLKIGPYELEDVVVTVPADGQKMNISDKTSRTTAGVQKGIHAKGLLGYDVLKHFVLTLDTKNWRAHIAAP
jgi:predicted aspartyl protease